MFLTVPGDVVAMPRRCRCEHCRGATDVMATAQRGELANAVQLLPVPCFEDSCAGVWLFRAITVGSVALAAGQFEWLA
ncbi:MAG TPA: hypothetical protein VNZ27_06455 [Rhodanobacter sp.]|jgi:hypothetical protein|nr:hypothetical protein [Rhodanobacter sp.]